MAGLLPVLPAVRLCSANPVPGSPRCPRPRNVHLSSGDLTCRELLGLEDALGWPCAGEWVELGWTARSSRPPGPGEGSGERGSWKEEDTELGHSGGILPPVAIEQKPCRNVSVLDFPGK